MSAAYNNKGFPLGTHSTSAEGWMLLGSSYVLHLGVLEEGTEALPAELHSES